MEEASLRPAGFPEQAARVAESLWPMALGSPSNSEWEREVSGHTNKEAWLPQMGHFLWWCPSCQCHAATMVSLRGGRESWAQQAWRIFHRPGRLLQE